MTQSLQAPETGGSQEERGEETLQRRGNTRNVLSSAHVRSGSFLFHCSRVILLPFPEEFNPVSSFCACTHTHRRTYTDTYQTHTDPPTYKHKHSHTYTDPRPQTQRNTHTDPQTQTQTDYTQTQTHPHTPIYTDLPNTHTYTHTLTCTDLPNTHTHTQLPRWSLLQLSGRLILSQPLLLGQPPCTPASEGMFLLEQQKINERRRYNMDFKQQKKRES